MTTQENTLEKISAGYFDGNRQSPIYTGDVYKEEGAMIPYHKVIKDPENGFMVLHVGTVEKFPLKTDAKNLIKKTYVGNEIDNPNLWDELSTKKDEPELNRHPQTTADEEIPADAPEDVKQFLNGETDELPAGTEEITPEEAEALADDVNNPADENSEENKQQEEDKKDDKNPPPDVVASTREEKRLQERRNDYLRRIEELKHKSGELETEAVKYENLASTLTFEPFVELKMIVSNAVQAYAKKYDVKEAQKHLNNMKAIDSMEALLKEYKDLADKDRANIELSNKEIDDYEIKVNDINDKLNNFQRKIAFVEPEQPKSETSAENEEPKTEENPEVETEAEVSQTEKEQGPEETTEQADDEAVSPKPLEEEKESK